MENRQAGFKKYVLVFSDLQKVNPGCKKSLFNLSVLFPAAVFWLTSLCSCEREPMAPILVLGSDSYFGTYTCEILKAEGFNAFVADSLTGDKITQEFIHNFDLIILGETSVTQSDKEMLSDFVKDGGNLIAFRPDKSLGGLFGIIPADTSIKEGYIKIDSINNIGKGLVHESLQFHGYSDIYKLNGGEEIASLFLSPEYYTGFPAVVLNAYGKGHAAAFAYNLPASIVLTRQGNPEWAGEERDKIDGPTATDLFYPLEGEVQWNDPEKIAIPQADEQMRLLSHIIEKFAGNRKPVPRFWYFPDQYKCIYVFTIDGEDSREADINNEILDVQGKGGNATLYEIGTYINVSTVSKWLADGNEVAIHYNDVPNYANPTFFNMNTVYDTMTANFRKVYGLSPVTARNHWVVWCSRDSLGNKDFAQQAKIEVKYGIGLDCNYYQFGGNNVYPNWLGDVGHFTGSGIPMKFADANGHILDIYQSNTQLPDETWLKSNVESKGKTLIDRSLDEENYTWINANFHTWYWPECRDAGLNILDYCNARGVPVFTAERVNNFLRSKDEAKFEGITWKNKTLSFKVVSTLWNRDRLTVILPADSGDHSLSGLTLDGIHVSYNRVRIKGTWYASVSVDPGSTHTFSAIYN